MSSLLVFNAIVVVRDFIKPARRVRSNPLVGLSSCVHVIDLTLRLVFCMRALLRSVLTCSTLSCWSCWPSSSDIDNDELLMNLRTEQDQIGHEIDGLRVRIDELKVALEDLWRDCTDAPYELTSVFIHRGSSPSWGHYFFYSRHLPNDPDSWFKYNDSDVTVINKSEVLADTTGSTANPYLLVFARKGSEVVETVNRFDMSNLTQFS